MALSIQSVKGTEDLYGTKASLYKSIETIAHNLAQNFGAEYINLPTLEHEELFKRSVGEETDIVSKEMFVFSDRVGRALCLRPEGTAQTVRFVLEQGLLRENLKRYFYMGSMFRAEKPQKGRQREFHQIGLEIIDEESPNADIEVINYCVNLLRELGLNEFELKINSIGCKNCRPSYIKKLMAFLQEHKNALCEECNNRTNTNPLRTFDCKNTECQKTLIHAPKIVDFLCEECSADFNSVKKGLTSLQIPYILDTALVRGLDYYTKTAFEISLPRLLGSQSAVCGGGRYNYLFEAFNPSLSVPSVGVAFGVERIIIALQEKGITTLCSEKELYYFIVDEKYAITALPLVQLLRSLNKKVLLDDAKRPLIKKITKANKLNAHFVIVLEEEEIKANELTIKDMSSGTQTKILQKNLAGFISKL